MFRNYPFFLYNKDSKNPVLIRDLYFQTSFYFQRFKENINIYEPYLIQDGDTPEDISFEFYQTYDYYFLILLLNDMKDPFYDWPLTNDELLAFATKYVTEDFWEIQEQIDYNPEDPTNISDPVVDKMIGRVFAQKQRENNKKRLIYLPPKNLMQDIHRQFLIFTSEFERERD